MGISAASLGHGHLPSRRRWNRMRFSDIEWLIIVAIIVVLFLIYREHRKAPVAVEKGAMSLSYYHDAEHGVSCWRPHDGSAAISCLPDSMLKTVGE